MRLINRKPSRAAAIFLGLLPFVALVITYVIANQLRLAENPSDKMLPAFESMLRTIRRMAFEPDVRTGNYLFWTDTLASLRRLSIALSLSAAIALVIGMLTGILPFARAFFAPFTSAFSLIPPITVLPILFIALGLGETSKIGLIIIGTAPAMIRGIAQAALNIPREVIVKAETLGATTWQIAMRVVLPNILPVVISALRIALIPAWIFLVSAEAIASTEGLGYRIFLVRRYLAMDLILPYVAWITTLAYLFDRGLLLISQRAFPWHHIAREAL